jgi:hypothetical protein
MVLYASIFLISAWWAHQGASPFRAACTEILEVDGRKRKTVSKSEEAFFQARILEKRICICQVGLCGAMGGLHAEIALRPPSERANALHTSRRAGISPWKAEALQEEADAILGFRCCAYTYN